MTMTKKERAAMDAAIERAELLAALRWTAPVDKDVAPPTDNGYSNGWTCNAYSKSVDLGWSSSVSHGSGPAPVSGRYTSGSQGRQWMFSTRAKALAAMRHELELIAARTLMEVDQKLRDEEGTKP